MGEISKVKNYIEYLFAFVVIFAVIFIAVASKSNPDFPYLMALCCACLPWLTFKVTISIITGETIISGMPKVVHKKDDPGFFWSIVLIYSFFWLLCTIYLCYYVTNRMIGT